MLHRMILAARSRIDLGDGPVQGDLGIFLAACMQTAVERELTGAMVWTGGHFLAVVEGRRDALQAVFDTLLDDRRLDRLKSLEFLPLTRRRYHTWAMSACDEAGCETACRPLLEAGELGAAEACRQVEDCLQHGRLAESPPLVVAA